MPVLSLCMIVRNEAAMLPDFLAATRDLRDEFIAVDTGSQDDTCDLLRAAGATVLDHAWDDDFAAARNRSLAPASGDWILVLDADERPTPDLVRQIRDLIEDPTAGAATIRMRNQLPHGHVRESDLLRLWRHDPAVRYRHRIHEEVATDVTTSLERSGRRLVNLSGRCEHLGYLRDVAAGRSKQTRDRDLLEACTAADPDDWYSWYKLLELARFWHDQTRWRDTARKVVERLEGPPLAALPAAPWAGELVALAAQGRFGDARQQIAWLDRWESRVPATPAFYLRRGMTLEAVGKADRARDDFERCRDLPTAAVPMLTTVRPLLGLCRLAAARGDLLAAGDYVHQALAHNPRDPEALLAAVSFAWLEGGDEARDAFVAEHRGLHGDSTELNQAIGEHALASGLWEDAVAALTTAAGEPPRGRAALMLAQADLGRGRPKAARDLCRDLMSELPEAGMGYLTSCLVLGDQVDFSVDLEQHQADAALKNWVRVLWRSRQVPLMSALVDNYPLIAGVFPWLPEFLTEQTRILRENR